MKGILLHSLLSLVAGGLYALTYPSFLGAGWMPLLFVALPLFLWSLENQRTLPRIFLIILCYNTGLNVTGYYWIPHTLREFGELPYVVSVVLGLFFALILQPHWWLYGIMKRYRPHLNWQSEKVILGLAFLITMLERFFPQQFPSFAGSPWLHLAPYLGLAPIFGVVIFSFMTYWVALETIVQLDQRKFRPMVWISLFIFVLFNALMPIQNPEAKESLKVRMVQANIGNFMKISSEKGEHNSYEAVSAKYLKLSTEKADKVDLVVWPETAYPSSFFGHFTELHEIFRTIMKSTNAEMLIGGYDHNMDKGLNELHDSVYNSSLLLSENKMKTAYHKNILIPFGETLPFGPFNTQIVSVVPAVSLFARGEGTPLMETKTGHRFVTPICYEILESNYMRSLLNQWGDNHFIVNHTNDSWYGDTAEPHQHLFLSKWRALEFMLPIVRSTNTGITSVIYPDGSESPRLRVGEEAYLDVNVPMVRQNTFYQIYGVLPLLGVFSIMLLLIWLRERFFGFKS